jgi:hypothetical protein
MTTRIGSGWSGLVIPGLVVLLATGCASPSSEPTIPVSDTSPVHEVASGAWLEDVARDLVDQVPCPDRDTYLDDLVSWDSMRGYDCVAGASTTSIRVYSHSVAVDQMVDEWRDSLGSGRAGKRGDHWIVVGPEKVVSRITAPIGDPTIAFLDRHGAEPTQRQEYLTTCAHFAFDEIVRRVRHEETDKSDAQYYEQLFPSVASGIRAFIAPDEVARLRAERDEDRWPSMLSRFGPKVKRLCSDAALSLPRLPTDVGESQ